MNVVAQWLGHEFVHSTQVHTAVWMLWHSGYGMSLFTVHKFTQLYECCGTVARAWVCSQYTSSHSCMNVVAQWLGHEFVHSTQVHAAVWMLWHSGYGMSLFTVHKFTQLYECCGTVARAWVCSQYTSSHSCMNVVAQWLWHEFVHSTQVHTAVWMLWHSG